MGKSLKERICEGLEDREGLIVPVIRNLMAEAWAEGYTAGHSRAMRLMSDEPTVAPGINPYKKPKEQHHGGSEAFRAG